MNKIEQKDGKLIVPHLEFHASHMCNFSCQSCSHFTNHKHNKIYSIDELKGYQERWADKIVSKSLAILGGEPLLNKDIINILYMTAEVWDMKHVKQFELVTNGMYLHKFPDLPKVLRDIGCSLALTIHSNESGYIKRINKILKLIQDWHYEYDINYYTYPNHKVWNQKYLGYGDYMKPFKTDYSEAWDYCLSGQNCFQLFRGKIYKCCLLAYLNLQKEKYDLSEEWDYYLTYEPLRSNASNEEIISFFNMGAEPYCSMCPGKIKTKFTKNHPEKPKDYYENNVEDSALPKKLF